MIPFNLMTAAHSGLRDRFYEPELDVLRFCAFLGVFCFHAVPDTYASLIPRFGALLPALLLALRNAMSFGVCMFFLLSSYLITKLLIVERERTGSIDLRNFYIRRILRIWPLYLGFLFSMWCLGKAGVFYPLETSRLIAFLLFAGNIYSGQFGLTYNPILPLWTVSIEEQFYILWPPLIKVASGALKASAILVVCLSVLATILLQIKSTNVSLSLWTSSVVQFQFFALGALLARRFSARLPTYRTMTRLGLATAGLLLLLIAGGPLHINQGQRVSMAMLSIGYELMALGVVLLFLAVLGTAKGRSSIPSVVTYLGKISYGLYVFHVLALQICGRVAKQYGLHSGFRFTASAGLTFVLAMISYRFVERPFLLLKERFTSVQTRPV